MYTVSNQSSAPRIQALLQLAPGVHLAPFDAGTQTPSYLAQFPDGRQFQLTEKLYHLLHCLQEPLAIPALAAALQRHHGTALEEAQLEALCIGRLVPGGLLTVSGAARITPAALETTGDAPARPRAAVLALHWRRDLLSASMVAPVAQKLSVLFTAVVAVPLVLAAVALHVAAYLRLGLPPALDPETVSLPLLSLLVLGSVGVHELGHLAACRRWGCAHGPLGIGLYFLSPVFYVDTSASWRLSRWQRAVIDVGGFYFQLACSVPLFLGYAASGNPTFLWALVLIDLMILTNLNPLAKFDGYWLLSDLLAMPNLHKRMGETLTFAPAWVLWRLGLRAHYPVLSPFAQVRRGTRVILSGYAALSLVLWTCFVLLVVPGLLTAVFGYPKMWVDDLGRVGAAMAARDMGALGGIIGSLIMSTLLLANIGVLVLRLARSASGLVHTLGRSARQRPWSRLSLLVPTGLAAAMLVMALSVVNLARTSVPLATDLGGIAAGMLAPDFTATDVHGRAVRLRDYRGRSVFLKFWSPDCRYCRDEIQAMREAYRTRGPGVVFLTVATRAAAPALISFTRRQQIGYPVFLDEQGAIAQLYHLKALPVGYVIAPDGRIERTLIGTQSRGGLVGTLNACSENCRNARAP